MALINYEDWLEAQYGVLGSMLISPNVVAKTLAQVTDEDFSGHCLAVYHAIRAIFSHGDPVDVVMVRDKLGADYTKFLMQLMEVTPTAANYQSYIDTAKKQSRFARLRDIGQHIADADSLETIQELLTQAVSVNSASQGIQAVTIQEALVSFFERHSREEKVEYIQWPIPAMNDQLFIDKGDFVIIGGNPSAGKTAFALQCAWSQSKHKNVGFYSLETGVNKLTDRQVAQCCGIPMEALKRNTFTQSHWEDMSAFAVQVDKTHRFEMITRADMTVSDIQAFSKARGYDIIYIDYVQLLQGRGHNQYEQITNLSMDLHRFSQSAGCAVVALSQLSRSSKGEKQVDPDMSYLRGSGQLEQDADAVLMLYLENDKQPNGRRILKCAKNKEGERFRVLLDFDGKTQRFSKASDFGAIQRQMAKVTREQREQERFEKSRQMEILDPDTHVPFEA